MGLDDNYLKTNVFDRLHEDRPYTAPVNGTGPHLCRNQSLLMKRTKTRPHGRFLWTSKENEPQSVQDLPNYMKSSVDYVYIPNNEHNFGQMSNFRKSRTVLNANRFPNVISEYGLSKEDYKKLKIQRKMKQIKLENKNKLMEESQLDFIDKRHKVWTGWYSMKVEQYKFLEKKRKSSESIFNKSILDYKNDRLKNMEIRQLDLLSWTKNKLEQIKQEKRKMRLKIEEEKSLQPTE